MRTTRTIPPGQDVASQVGLYVSFELADEKWKLSLSDGRRGPSQHTVDAGDTVAALACLTKARRRCGLRAQCKFHSCYGAGRDGWWLHRWLIEQGIDNIVVDAASIEVNRRACHSTRMAVEEFALDQSLQIGQHMAGRWLCQPHRLGCTLHAAQLCGPCQPLQMAQARTHQQARARTVTAGVM
ncbi:MAG: hypothetical protein Q7T97_16800 [Burkholderiaceae bacterium]|nr:hypothetical protein [Burkholderiaceae bacterium]